MGKTYETADHQQKARINGYKALTEQFYSDSVNPELV